MIACVTPEEAGSRIRRARLRRRWTQAEAAERLGVSTRALGDWERGATTPRNPVVVEDVLGISLEGDTEVDPREEELRSLVADMPAAQAEELLQLYRHLRDRHPTERAG